MTFSTRAVNAKANAIAELLDGGVLEICAGEPPKDADKAVSDYAPLARLTFDVPAFDAADEGVIVAQAIGPEEAAPGAGTARWFRCLTADGYPVLDGAIGPELTLSSTTILVGTRVTIEQFTYTEPKE